MNFVDRLFLLEYDQTAFAAAMPAGMLLFALLSFPLGIASYVNAFVAQYHGAGRPERIGVAIGQATLFSLFVAPLFLLLIPLAPTIFHDWSQHDGAVAVEEVKYFQVMAWGSGGAVLAGALSSFFTGRGQTKVVMVVMVSTTSLNVLLDYLWIFGNFGFAEMGIGGAALATVVSQWGRVIAYACLMLRRHERQRFQILAGLRFDRPLMGRLLYYGAPNGLQMFVECAAMALFLLLLGLLGEEALAATTLAFNVNSIAFVPLIGMGIAVSTMVGHQLGAGSAPLATRATYSALHLALVYTGVMAVLYVALPDLFLFGHASATSPEEFKPLRETTIVLLRFVALYCVFDALNIVFQSAIKGAGDTRFVLILNMILSPLLVAAIWIGLKQLDLGLYYCWSVVTIWVWLLGVIYGARFLQGRWQSMRVIEAEPLEIVNDPASAACYGGNEARPPAEVAHVVE